MTRTATKGLRIAALLGSVAVLAAALFMWASWDEIRAWYVLGQHFEHLGKNEQGYREYRHKQTAIVFVRLPGGKFLMGSPESEEGRRTWEQQREISVSLPTNNATEPGSQMERTPEGIDLVANSGGCHAIFETPRNVLAASSSAQSLYLIQMGKEAGYLTQSLPLSLPLNAPANVMESGSTSSTLKSSVPQMATGSTPLVLTLQGFGQDWGLMSTGISTNKGATSKPLYLTLA